LTCGDISDTKKRTLKKTRRRSGTERLLAGLDPDAHLQPHNREKAEKIMVATNSETF
jgi:hypothetical protein